MLRYLIVALAAALFAVGGGSAMAAKSSGNGIHFLEVSCTSTGTAVNCEGTLVGLGTVPTSVQVVADAACATRGNGNEPKGHIQGTSEPITPRGGRIDFDVTSGSASCPNGLNPTIGDTATINVFQSGNLVFTDSVSIA
jgi:hypothetical protein